jgi:hypothetical protein
VSGSNSPRRQDAKDEDLPLRCRCGRVRGVAKRVSPTGIRLICYCKDCQAFALFLGRTDVLDIAGGTDIFQMPPGQIDLSEGVDALGCVQFSDKVLRWYALCCRTPIANTPAAPGFPLAGLIHSFIDHTVDGRSRDQAIGPLLCRIYGKSASGPFPPNCPDPPTAWISLRRISRLLVWWARGLERPTPFFDSSTNAVLWRKRHKNFDGQELRLRF